MEGKISQFRIKGMTRDLSRSKFSPEYAYELKNLRIVSQGHGSLFSLVNERGQKKITFQPASSNIKNITIYGNISESDGVTPELKEIVVYGSIFELEEPAIDSPQLILISGTVRNYENQSVISSANVSIRNVSNNEILYSTMTDTDGSYQLYLSLTKQEWGSSGPYYVVCSKTDYVAQNQTDRYTINTPDYNYQDAVDYGINNISLYLYMDQSLIVKDIEIFGTIMGNDTTLFTTIINEDGTVIIAE
jgi:hypothetical protein